MSPLYARYRPKAWNEVIGQDKTLKRLESLRKSGIVGHAIWIYGQSGTGKTTIARLLAAEVADPFCTVEVDAQDVSVDQLREWERVCSGKPLMGSCFAFIINEAHGLSGRVVSRFQTLLESDAVQRNSVWLFTTTVTGQKKMFDGCMDAKPFLSRANVFEFATDKDVIWKFASRASEIAKAENLDGKPLKDYVSLVAQCGCNMREVLSKIEAGEMLL